MKYKFLKILLTVLLASAFGVGSFAVNAGLYKGIDADGNVVYSDTPFDDAEKYTAPPISVVDTPKTGAKKEVKDEKPAEFKYISFDIVSPSHQETVRNISELVVSLKLSPGLNAKENHSIWLIMDGKPVVKNSQSMSLKVSPVYRGEHKLQAQIRDPEGKIIVRTRTNSVFVHKTSAP